MFVSLSIYISQKLKYMDILLVILGVICLLVGLAGVFADLAGAAGSVFGFVAVAFYGLCGIYGYGVGRVGDCWSCWYRRWTMLRPCWGLSIAEGPSGEIGDVPVGTVAGIFVFPPWGILLGPFVGAFVGELLGGKASGDALKASFGAFAGFLLSVVLKVTLCGYFIYSFVRGIIN